MSGKGSTPRPYSVTAEQFADSWSRIFGSKEKEGQGESQPEVKDNGSEQDGQAD